MQVVIGAAFPCSAMRGPRHFYEVVWKVRALLSWQYLYSNYLFGNDVAVDSACRLYFDIEYKTELNPQTNSTTALETFIQVRQEASELYLHFVWTFFAVFFLILYL